MQQPSFWWRPRLSVPALVLAPLAVVYGWVAGVVGRMRAARAYYAAVPVVSVGNLSVGGSGKTPLVEALATHFAARGEQVAVVMRGYGGQMGAQPLQVRPEHPAALVGDEARMLATACAGQRVAVWVGANRPAVVRRAEQAGATFIVLDDAFQRRDVARTVDILVLDGARPWPFGNGLVLPAGPLRESLGARTRADFAVLLNAKPTPTTEAPPYYGLLTYRPHTQLVAADVKALAGKSLLAFCGLGNPDKFFAALRQAGLQVSATVRYADHYAYPPRSVAYLRRQAQMHGLTLVTTAKDAVKLPPGVAQVVRQEITPDAEWQNVLAALAAKVADGLAP